MSRGPEGRFQDSTLALWRAQGIAVQKFNDLYSEGIPDTMLKFPVRLPGGVESAWIEFKAFDEWPKRPTSPLPAKCKPTEAQIRWMKAFGTPTVPCFVLIGTPDGWLLTIPTLVDSLWTVPCAELKLLVQREKPTIGRMMKAIA